MNFPVDQARTSRPTSRSLQSVRDLGLVSLAGASGLQIELLPGGAVFAMRHGGTLINQVIPGAEEEGLFRLLLRWRGEDGAVGWAPLAHPGLSFSPVAKRGARWTSEPAPGLEAAAVLSVHPELDAWAWRVHVKNRSPAPRSVDALLHQDLGLGDQAAVQTNEAYNSHYIDLLPVEDAELGWVVLARQNQAMSGGRHLWLAAACAEGAAAFCTDAWQFFGVDHRLTNEPAAVRAASLPSRRLQYECAAAGLQSRDVTLAPGESVAWTFVFRFVEDHPAASTAKDIARVRELMPVDWIDAAPSVFTTPAPVPLFVTAPWLHGRPFVDADWERWFPGERRHLEHGPGGAVWSFFHGNTTHVVSREKEAFVTRPHGYILRSGDGRWIDGDQFGVTCFAAGVFGAQAYLGNSSFARLLPVVRNALGLDRARGQRIFIRHGDSWCQLGVPSAFAMTPSEVRWIYHLDACVLEVRVRCGRGLSASFLDLRVADGPAQDFLITHSAVLNTTELEHSGTIISHGDENWVELHPAASSLVGKHQPELCFAIVADAGPESARMEIEAGRVSVRTEAVSHLRVVMLGVLEGASELERVVAMARGKSGPPAEFATTPLPPVRLRGGVGFGALRLDEILPWFAHNASIHFSAPHGLEQSGGAAWGVRDVTQGSMEWLLAAGEFAVARRMLEVVFAQQYAGDGTWPQWFMHAPYRFTQQVHSHGDVCFWPVKALCDYIEASNDFDVLASRVGYTSTDDFSSIGPVESLVQHCDRVVAHVESRFLADTVLVDYGDGDWDDTLQPAKPALRTRMVSGWTVALAYHTFGDFANVLRRRGEEARTDRLDVLLARMRADFVQHLMPEGIAAGFLIRDPDGDRFLFHPRDETTGIRYRLLPMTRAILAGLFTPDEAQRHLDIIRDELLFADGVRLLSQPVCYQGGVERLFKRAETAANVGREIGLQYVHAHLRYAEALARVGDAEGLWRALQVVNPIGLREILPQAAPRQANVYFSSSDADFADRYEASARWDELRAGTVAVRGGWRLYSSGPGIFLHTVRSCLLGIRESFGDVVFDPVLPACLDGLVACVTIHDRLVEVHYAVRRDGQAPESLVVNGRRLAGRRDHNPYRRGGLRVSGAELSALLAEGDNVAAIEVQCVSQPLPATREMS